MGYQGVPPNRSMASKVNIRTASVEDFFTRARCVHALLTGDATLLRQAFGFLLEAGVEPIALVHDLQNHDEITYQLVELEHRKDETFTLRGEKVTGKQLREQMLREMRAQAAGARAPHNK